MILFKASPEAAVKGSIMKGGLTAIISILGVSWLGLVVLRGQPARRSSAASPRVIQSQPVGLRARAVRAVDPALQPGRDRRDAGARSALALGLSAPLLVGAYPAVNGNFFLPTYGTVLAAVSFDQTGTTRIGKYLLNHSFMLPGLVDHGDRDRRRDGARAVAPGVSVADVRTERRQP